MTQTAAPQAAPGARRPVMRRLAWLTPAVAVLVIVAVLSIAVGSALLAPDEVWRAITAPDGSATQVTVTEARVSRTLLGLLVGAALGVAGALLQALTRNPLADPGVLGINAGAAFAVTVAVAALGVTRIDQYLPFAFAGAVLAVVVVFVVAGGGGDPLRMTLVGAALSAVLMGVSQTLALIDVDTFDRMRFWGAGTITDRPDGTVEAIVLPIAIGLVVAAVCVRPLDVMALGDDTARSLGIRLGLVRAGVLVAVALLCGAATAAAGPLVFVGLVVPHIVRWITGPSWVWVTVYSALLTPVLLLGADIVGRLVVLPGELSVGVMTPLIGAPVLVALVRGRKARAL